MLQRVSYALTAMGYPRWVVDYGLWQWVMGYGLRATGALGYGLWPTFGDLRSTVNGQRSPVYGLWSTVYNTAQVYGLKKEELISFL